LVITLSCFFVPGVVRRCDFLRPFLLRSFSRPLSISKQVGVTVLVVDCQGNVGLPGLPGLDGRDGETGPRGLMVSKTTPFYSLR